MGNICTSGPNQALVISGGWCGGESKKYIVGGWGWSWWFVSSVERIGLNVMTIKPTCTGVETKKGVPLTVTGVAQVNVMTRDKTSLKKASENFMGRSIGEIQEQIQETLEGHLRAIVGQLTVEEIYREREPFARQVRETAKTDLIKMGIDILSFVVQTIHDDVDYLNSIGKARTAEVVKEATIGATNSDRDAQIQEAECDQARTDAKMKSDTAIDNAKRTFETTNAECETLINKAQTEAKLAYDLQKAKEEQVIRDSELEVEVIKRRKQIEVEAAEVIRREKELEANERKPAEFNAKKVELLAEGEKLAKVLIAEAEAQKIRLLGGAEAKAIEATGSAEAVAMQLKAEAMQAYGKQALVQMVLESLPALAAEVSQPLGKIDDIVLLGGDNDRLSTEVAKLIAEGPAVIKALTGVDVSGAVKMIPGAV